ncbi:large ribosomal subunit protein bL21m-like [Saccostrea echinata]|uniref:large ribosomal subunit protein bL21m-like n=1 Tax=Saccostrea echinata TaxID=191078 RepID=UPI002A817374|nr:large ribosomal subunit protein bL21m-like [Saccostrea echinata]
MNITFWKRCESLVKHVNICCPLANVSTGSVLRKRGQDVFRPPHTAPVSYSVKRYFHLQSVCLAHRVKEADDLAVTQTESVKKTEGITEAVNSCIDSEDLGRLFAVVHLAGFQRKVTVNDLVVMESSSFPTVGTRIRLEKVLLVGSKDFTLVGRPILSRSVVNIEATVIEKTLSPMVISFLLVRRKRVRKTKMQKNQQTVLLINSIEVNPIKN